MVGRAAKTIAFLCHFMYTCWEDIATLSIDHLFEYNVIAYEENNAALAFKNIERRKKKLPGGESNPAFARPTVECSQ